MGLWDIYTSIKNRAEKFLNEKNVITDFLGKVEEKTGIKKKVIAVGRVNQELLSSLVFKCDIFVIWLDSQILEAEHCKFEIDIGF